jgi:hypothetical protein
LADLVPRPEVLSAARLRGGVARHLLDIDKGATMAWFWWFLIIVIAVLAVVSLAVYTFVKNRKEEKIFEE